MLLILVPLAAFGGTYAITAIPLGLFTIACAVIARPAVKGTLDTALLAIVLCVALQVVPLPSAVAGILSPHWQAMRSALSLTATAGAGVRPLSIRATETVWALSIVLGTFAMFILARASYGRGGVRRTVRAIAIIGCGVSCVAIAQAATAGRYVYWLFPTPYDWPAPFGPFINRNHFATWIIMALPVSVGYLAAHTEMEGMKASVALNPRARVQYLIDPRGAWLTGASGIMLLALLLSLSRSGALALVIAGTITFLVVGRHLPRDRRMFLFGTAALLIGVTFGWTEVGPTRGRGTDVSTELAGRMQIWRETLPVIRDFWLTGTGAGTYRTAMLLYQQSDRSIYFNQANNHYLQLAAEGGLLLILPLLLAVRAFVRSGYAALSRDNTPMLWIRAGAACGLVAVALQSLWETGLVMPANAFLAAVVAALLVHQERRQQQQRRTTGR